ncbi:MAG TPA: hypothetical protein VM056_03435, partial [Terriglobales bacterium]|nr:hypothetical protein [Terriglobales bacterium]
TVRVLDAAGNSTTKQFSLTVNPVQPVITESYGNVGDAYEGAAPGTAVSLSACQILTADTKYRLSRSVNALTPTDVCYQFTAANISLDLNGYKVTGRVIAQAANINGAQILNGTVECNRDDSLGGNVGCVWLYGDTFPIAAQLRVHHLTINNTATCGRSLALEWNPSAPWTGGQYAARFYHISITTAAGPSCPRAHNLGVIASSSVTVEAHNNDLTCPADTAGCQGIVFYGNGHGRIHHNRVTMLMNTTAQSGRAILCDGGADYCEVDNNLVIVNNNRAFRVRDSAHARIHDNVVEQVKCCNAMAVHLGDPDAGSNDLDVIVEKNSFEVVDGVVLMIRAGFNAWFRNNTINCASCTATAKLAQVRSAGTTSISFENNPSATLLAPSQISVESGTTATICASGQASGTGTISYNTACQSP